MGDPRFTSENGMTLCGSGDDIRIDVYDAAALLQWAIDEAERGLSDEEIIDVCEGWLTELLKEKGKE